VTNFDHREINDIIHGRVRLTIMAALASHDEETDPPDTGVDFSHLKKLVKASDGNLSIHIRKLEDAGYLEVTKRFSANRPQTLCRLTDDGRKAFAVYLSHLESLLPPRA